MTITKVLNDSTLTDTEKLATIEIIVSKARASYGNTELEIAEPVVSVVSGVLELSELSEEDKIALCKSEVQSIKETVRSLENDYDGIVVEKEIERCIALSPFFTNINKKSEVSQYI